MLPRESSAINKDRKLLGFLALQCSTVAYSSPAISISPSFLQTLYSEISNRKTGKISGKMQLRAGASYKVATLAIGKTG